MIKKALFLAILLFAIYGIAKYPQVEKIAYTASGFSAKNICSGHFISGFKKQDIINQALLPIDKSFGYVDTLIDEKLKRVESSIFGLFSRVASYQPATGCRLWSIEESKAGLHSDLGLASVNRYRINSKDASLSFSKQPKAQKILEDFFSAPEDAARRSKAILVWHKGQVIAEKYADGVNENTPLLSWSMAKSITNMLVGIMVNKQMLSLDKPLQLTEWKNKPQHNEITLDHLLRMSSGLEFNETYGIGSDAAIMLSIEPSAGKFAALKPVIYPPDSHWSYSSGTTNIISLVMRRAIAGDENSYYQFAQRELFEPLGISSATLELDAAGTIIGSSYMYATTRDWAKLGLLMLNEGVWNGVRILPKNWVTYSITATPTDLLNHYGAHFWLNYDPTDKEKQRVWPKLPNDTYYMGGFQGQRVVIIPSKGLVVVRMGFTTPGSNNGVEDLVAELIASIES